MSQTEAEVFYVLDHGSGLLELQGTLPTLPEAKSLCRRAQLQKWQLGTSSTKLVTNPLAPRAFGNTV